MSSSSSSSSRHHRSTAAPTTVALARVIIFDIIYNDTNSIINKVLDINTIEAVYL